MYKINKNHGYDEKYNYDNDEIIYFTDGNMAWEFQNELFGLDSAMNSDESWVMKFCVYIEGLGVTAGSRDRMLAIWVRLLGRWS